jgi:Zn-dependent protease/CBS domain-containing protein
VADSSFQIVRVAGLPIRVHISWFVILILATWSLATGWYPAMLPEASEATWWILGATGALGLFTSILLHEMAHAIVGRRLGVRTRAITLFLFGGVAELETEPESPSKELRVALAGPLATVVIIGLLTVARWSLAEAGSGDASNVAAVILQLLFVNISLLVFNLVPAFPLDGGRVLRSVLWRWKDDLRWATRVASNLGGYFGATLILLGLVLGLTSNLVSGMWLALIGLFLRGAAGGSYQQLLLRQMLEGEPVRRFTTTRVVSVPPDMPLDRFIEEYVFRYRHSAFPVVDGDRVLGMADTKSIRSIPRETRETVDVRDVLTPASPSNSVGPNQDSLEAFAKMQKNGLRRLLVVSPSGRLEGLLSLSDLMELFRLKLELDDADPGPTPPMQDESRPKPPIDT